MKFLTVIRSTLLLVIIVSCPNIYSSEALENGYAALENNQTKKAMQYFQIALKENPDSIEVSIGLAKIYYRKRMIKQAENLIGTILQVEANNIDALFIRAKIEQGKNNLENAKKILINIVERQPDNVQANMALADVFNALGETTSADVIYEKYTD